MSWFSRATATPDPMLPMLSVDDAEWLRGRAVQAFAAAGALAPTAAGDHVVGADGEVYGLGNLAAAVAATPGRERDEVVRDYARAVMTSLRRQEPASLAEIADIVVARVVDARSPGAGVDLAPGLAVRACVDYPETVATLTDLDRLGGWAAVGPVALANLARLPLPDHQPVPARGGGTVHLLSSEDMFGASRLLVLDDLLRRVLRTDPPAVGSLVAVPHRHLLAVHLLEDESVVPAMSALIGLARAGTDAAGPVSPEVYYRGPDGRLQQITMIGADGSVGVQVDGEFAAAMASLGLIS